MGQIANLAAAAGQEEELTPLQKEIKRFILRLMIFSLIIGALLFGLGFAIGYSAVLMGCYVLALFLRFEGVVPARHWQGTLRAAPWFVVLSLLGYHLAGLYHGVWRYASTVTLFQVFKGATLSAASLVMLYSSGRGASMYFHRSARTDRSSLHP